MRRAITTKKSQSIPFYPYLCVENKPVTRTGLEGSLHYTYTHTWTKKKAYACIKKNNQTKNTQQSGVPQMIEDLINY